MTGYRPQSEDTSEAVDRMVFDGLHAMTPVERLELARLACQGVHRMTIAGLRMQFPDAGDEELDCRAKARRLGRDLTLRFFGADAEVWLDGTVRIRSTSRVPRAS